MDNNPNCMFAFHFHLLCTVNLFELRQIFLNLFDTDNLLLTENHTSVKLADFGLAREESVTEMMTAETGTYCWMAPEVSIFFLACQ